MKNYQDGLLVRKELIKVSVFEVLGVCAILKFIQGISWGVLTPRRCVCCLGSSRGPAFSRTGPPTATASSLDTSGIATAAWSVSTDPEWISLGWNRTLCRSPASKPGVPTTTSATVSTISSWLSKIWGSCQATNNHLFVIAEMSLVQWELKKVLLKFVQCQVSQKMNWRLKKWLSCVESDIYRFKQA